MTSAGLDGMETLGRLAGILRQQGMQLLPADESGLCAGRLRRQGPGPLCGILSEVCAA